jgi:methionyl-tRNA formyltransferase
MKERIIFFGDSTSYISTILFRGLMRAVARTDFEIVAIVDTALLQRPSLMRRCLFYAAQKIFNPCDHIDLDLSRPFYRYSRLPVYHPVSINSSACIEQLRIYKPTIALLCGCPQIMHRDLMAEFNQIVNYHNSLLPRYRGLQATAWSMYKAETTTGYTFHYVSEGVDLGNIVIQESFPLDYHKTPDQIEHIKTDKAQKTLGKLLTLLSDHAPGQPQPTEGSYFGAKELSNLQHLAGNVDPLLAKTIIRYFGGVYIGDEYVTKITGNRYTRFSYLPRWLFRIMKKLRWLQSAS